MAKTQDESPTQKQAEAGLREAQAALAAAADEAAQAGQTLAAAKMQNVPDMVVVVLPNQTVSHDGKTYYGEGYPFAPEGHEGGDEIKMDGPAALSMMQLGHVTIKGAAA